MVGGEIESITGLGKAAYSSGNYDSIEDVVKNVMIEKL